MLMLGLAGWVVDWLLVRRRLARRGRTQLLYSADGDGLGWYSLCDVGFFLKLRRWFLFSSHFFCFFIPACIEISSHSEIRS